MSEDVKAKFQAVGALLEIIQVGKTLLSDPKALDEITGKYHDSVKLTENELAARDGIENGKKSLQNDINDFAAEKQRILDLEAKATADIKASADGNNANETRAAELQTEEDRLGTVIRDLDARTKDLLEREGKVKDDAQQNANDKAANEVEKKRLEDLSAQLEEKLGKVNKFTADISE